MYLLNKYFKFFFGLNLNGELLVIVALQYHILIFCRLEAHRQHRYHQSCKPEPVRLSLQ